MSARKFCVMCEQQRIEVKRLWRPESAFISHDGYRKELPEALVHVCKRCLTTPVEHFASGAVIDDWMRRNKDYGTAEEPKWSFWG